MIRAANKLAEGGGTATVTGEILDAMKMINRMGKASKLNLFCFCVWKSLPC